MLCFKTLVYANDSLFVVKQIVISGNNRTKESVIKREIPFFVGDTINSSDTSAIALKTEQNLINTSLFHFASVSFCDSGMVTVSVTERWYIWPVPFINIEERSFNVWLRDMSLEKFTYGAYVYHENFRGRKEYLKVLFKSGYNKLYAVSYSKPYIDKNQNWGISASLGFEASHFLTGSVFNHEPVTFKLSDDFSYSGLFSSVAAYRRVGIYQQHKITINYESTRFADSLFRVYGFYAPKTNWSRFALNYQYRYDFRDVKNYPLKGWYADMEFNFGDISKDLNKNDISIFAKSNSKKYFNISKAWNFAMGLTFYLSLKEPKYFFSSGFMGYGNDFVRGFQYRVIPVRNYFINRNNLKLCVLSQKILKMPYIKTSKFNRVPLAVYINSFFDQGWSSKNCFSDNNNLSGKYLLGYGLGVDFVTYYDKVFRIEFTMNRFYEKGIFLHFIAPI